MKDNDRNQKFTMLYEKALKLISEQYDDYKITHGKTTTLISLSAFIFPLILSTSDLKEFDLSIVLLLIIPLITYLSALILFSVILFPKELKHGVQFSKIEKSFNDNYIDILKKEIIALKKAFEINKQIIEKQNKRLKTSIILILFSIGFVSILVFIGHSVRFNNETSKINMEKLNNLKLNAMETESLFNESNSDKQNLIILSQDSSDEESIPDVSEDELESFTKGDEDDFEKK